MLKQKKVHNNIIQIKQKQKKAYNTSINNQSQNIRNISQKVIKFIGDPMTNIQQTLSTINCNRQTRQQFKQILMIYATKIIKLRQQRNVYRDMLLYKQQKENKQIIYMKQQIKKLEQQIIYNNQQICTCRCYDKSQRSYITHHHSNINSISVQGSSLKHFLDDKQQQKHIQNNKSNNNHHEIYKNHSNIHQEIYDNQPNIHHEIQKSQQNHDKHQQTQQLLVDSLVKKDNYQQDSLIISRSQRLGQSSANNNVTQEQLMKLMFKYNISIEELENIFQGYQNQHKKVFQLYDEQNQQKLYKLGLKMQKDLNNKKVLKDLKNLSQMKNKAIK